MQHIPSGRDDPTELWPLGEKLVEKASEKSVLRFLGRGSRTPKVDARNEQFAMPDHFLKNLKRSGWLAMYFIKVLFPDAGFLVIQNGVSSSREESHSLHPGDGRSGSSPSFNSYEKVSGKGVEMRYCLSKMPVNLIRSRSLVSTLPSNAGTGV